MKVCMIAPVGKSPAVVTELALYLDGLEGDDLTDIILMPTENEFVEAGMHLIAHGCMRRFPNVRIHVEQLNYSDIETDEQNIDFMKKVVKTIRVERERYKVNKIYLNVAGGRKVTCISLAQIGGLMGVDGAFHLIHKEVDTINLPQERMKSEILGILEAEDMAQYYEIHKEDFDRLLFPPFEDFRVLKIPIIPFPPDMISLLKRLLHGLNLDEEKVEYYKLETFKKAGLLWYHKNRCEATEFGRAMLEVLEG